MARRRRRAARPARALAPGRRPLTVLYAVPLPVTPAFLSVLEPMVGKFLLPPLGSTPSVWNTTVLFFQATLLAGYLWSHFTRRLHPVVQVATLALGVISLPIAVAADLTPSSHP